MKITAFGETLVVPDPDQCPTPASLACASAVLGASKMLGGEKPETQASPESIIGNAATPAVERVSCVADCALTLAAAQ